MLEHGRCARGSSRGFWGANTPGLVAILLSSKAYTETCYCFFCCDGAHVSLTAVTLRTLNVGWVPPGITVPRTVTLWPMCFANASVGKPSASRIATSARSVSLVRTYLPFCSSTQPVIEALALFDSFCG